MKKLNVGCGSGSLPGWINIDIAYKEADYQIDVTKPLPFASDTIDFIHSEAFIEHITASGAVSFLKEARRILKTNGVIRTSTFDLDELIVWCRPDNPRWREDVGVHIGPLAYIQTRAEFLDVAFRMWGHTYLYNEEEMIRRYKEAGFTELKVCKMRESDHPELRNLEGRSNMTLIIEATK